MKSRSVRNMVCFMFAFLLGVLPDCHRAVPVAPPPQRAPTIATALDVSTDLYVEIRCAGSRGEAIIGTGIPITINRILTANHVACQRGEIMLAGTPNGTLPMRLVVLDSVHDLKVLATVVDAGFMSFAKFRDQVTIGETVVGRGAALSAVGPGCTTIGIVALHVDGLLLTTNTPLGGMSGSALVGSDGRVVGMTIGFLKDTQTGGILSVAVGASHITALLKS